MDTVAEAVATGEEPSQARLWALLALLILYTKTQSNMVTVSAVLER